MPFYYYILIALALASVAWITYYLKRNRKNIPQELFLTALRNENSGDFEEAVIIYETALQEATKGKFLDNDLKIIINEKLKTLYTVIEYRKNFHSPDSSNRETPAS